MKGSKTGITAKFLMGLGMSLGMSLGLAPTWSLAASAAPSGLVQAIQSEIDGEANGIARGYFIQLGEKIAPEDIGFRSEVFLRSAAGGSSGAAGSQTLERILVTAYIPESYPDGMIIDFRAKFRKHFEEQGYVVVFGPEATQVDTSASSAAPWFDFRVRRAPPPWLGEAAPVLSTSLAATGQGGREMTPKALIQLFGGRVDLDGIKAIFAPLWSQVTGALRGMGKAELSLVAGAGAAVAFILLVMIALAPGFCADANRRRCVTANIRNGVLVAYCQCSANHRCSSQDIVRIWGAAVSIQRWNESALLWPRWGSRKFSKY